MLYGGCYFLFNETTGEYEGTFDEPKLAGECLADWQDDDELTPEVAERYALYVLRISDLHRVRFERTEKPTNTMRAAYLKICNDAGWEQEVNI